jgi:hypothetical protein
MSDNDSEFDSGDDLFDNVSIEQIPEINAYMKRKKTDKDDYLPTPLRDFAKRQKIANPAATQGPDDAALEEGNLELARRILRDKFGHDDFRHEQQGAIRRVLAGKNALVVFPTGAGKSLCYQVSSCFSYYALQMQDAFDWWSTC